MCTWCGCVPSDLVGTQPRGGAAKASRVKRRVRQAVEGKTKHTHCQNVSLLLSRNISTPLPGFADVTVHTENGVKT
jgi:hypothetical protein